METNFPTGQNEIEERLWSYIDGIATADEKNVIDQLLLDNSAWKAKYHELLELNQLLQASELEAPSMRFGKNVMEEITRLHIAPATRTYINKKIIWAIGVFLITIIIGFLIYGFGQMKWTAGEGTAISVTLDKVDMSKFFNNSWVNAFMMINVVLGLFLLDNYLSAKRKEYRKEFE